jgi:hypothetical protein
MDWKIELVAIPVTDVDRAKAFYVDQVGFHADHDYQVTEALRFVQLTPPGSACSIVLGTGVTEMPPGSQKGVQVVVADVEAARQRFSGHPSAMFHLDALRLGPPADCSAVCPVAGVLRAPGLVARHRLGRRAAHVPRQRIPQRPGHARRSIRCPAWCSSARSGRYRHVQCRC